MVSWLSFYYFYLVLSVFSFVLLFLFFLLGYVLFIFYISTLWTCLLYIILLFWHFQLLISTNKDYSLLPHPIQRKALKILSIQSSSICLCDLILTYFSSTVKLQKALLFLFYTVNTHLYLFTSVLFLLFFIFAFIYMFQSGINFYLLEELFIRSSLLIYLLSYVFLELFFQLYFKMSFYWRQN